MDAERPSGGGPIEVTHTHVEGTIARGTNQGDGSAAVLKANAWRWSGHLNAWYVPRSRDLFAKTQIIEKTRRELIAAGFGVTADVDDTITRSVEEREADLKARSERTAEVLHGRADWQRAAGAEAAQRTQGLADRLEGATERRYSRRAVGERLGRLEVKLRKVVRALEGYKRKVGNYVEIHEPATGKRAEQLQLERVDLEAQVAYWREVRDQLNATEPTYSQETISRGDLVRISGQWRRVARVNRKSVSVETGYSWTDKAPYHHITEHRSGEEPDGPQP